MFNYINRYVPAPLKQPLMDVYNSAMYVINYVNQSLKTAVKQDEKFLPLLYLISFIWIINGLIFISYTSMFINISEYFVETIISLSKEINFRLLIALIEIKITLWIWLNIWLDCFYLAAVMIKLYWIAITSLELVNYFVELLHLNWILDEFVLKLLRAALQIWADFLEILILKTDFIFTEIHQRLLQEYYYIQILLESWFYTVLYSYMYIISYTIITVSNICSWVNNLLQDIDFIMYWNYTIDLWHQEILNFLFIHDFFLIPIKYSPLVNETNLLLENYQNLNKFKHEQVIPIVLNVNKNTPLNTHFPVYKSSIVLTITVWQYWWWLSFIFIIITFNRLIIKFFFQNTIKIEPKVHTSTKSNGRWGDLVASLFPIFWCSNILVNSNFILRVIENHSESAMYVLRVRGKQWYWVYKFSVNIKQDVNNASIIIGRNNKLNITYNLNKKLPDNTLIPRKRWQNKINIFFKATQHSIVDKLNYTSSYNTNVKLKNLYHTTTLNFYKKFLDNKLFLNYNQYVLKKIYKHDKHHLSPANEPLMVLKTYKCCGNDILINKLPHSHSYKRYNRFFYSIQQQPKKSWKGIKKNTLTITNQPDTNFTTTNRLLKKITPLTINKKNTLLRKFRLISTYNSLILPTNVNITVITNSFDVVHSWFIPGLGLKFDCVPGRSTHYTLRIQKPGIYIGHCAEVCGRFHHHMPIKVIALPLHHFLYYHNIQYTLK